jgi:hypothetical protein
MATKMTKVLIHLPVELKQRLDSKRSEGYSLSGFVRDVSNETELYSNSLKLLGQCLNRRLT